jgi:hypothetical protein
MLEHRQLVKPNLLRILQEAICSTPVSPDGSKLLAEVDGLSLESINKNILYRIGHTTRKVPSLVQQQLN